MHVSVSVRFSLKKIEKGYRGLCRESWAIAKKEPFSLSFLGALLIGRLIDFWLVVHHGTSTQEVRGQIKEMAALIGAIEIRDDRPATG